MVNSDPSMKVSVCLRRGSWSARKRYSLRNSILGALLGNISPNWEIWSLCSSQLKVINRRTRRISRRAAIENPIVPAMLPLMCVTKTGLWNRRERKRRRRLCRLTSKLMRDNRKMAYTVWIANAWVNRNTTAYIVCGCKLILFTSKDFNATLIEVGLRTTRRCWQFIPIGYDPHKI
jgi:hypothetical protein